VTPQRIARTAAKFDAAALYNDNVTIFDEIAKGNADLMLTDSSETRYQQKLHAGVLCAIHPEKPFDHAEKAYWLQRDAALRAFVGHWVQGAIQDGSFAKIYAGWFEWICAEGRRVPRRMSRRAFN
jgi:cyclohexadienyl dehydratase